MQNGATVTVAAGCLAACKWALENPKRGIVFPEALDWEYIMKLSLPYLGSFISRPVPWCEIEKNQIVNQQLSILKQ